MSSVDPLSPAPDASVPASERAFYVEEFRGATIVVSLEDPTVETVASVGRAAASLTGGDGRLVAVVEGAADRIAGALPTPPVVFDAPAGPVPDDGWVAELWLAITDEHEVIVRAPTSSAARLAAEVAVALRALKLVVTGGRGGWGRPPRSFADVRTHAEAYASQLADRQEGAVLAALDRALAGGVTNVNLCRPEDLDRELFTYDGAGTLFTSGGYVELDRLRVDDLPAVEALVAQGVADGLLRPRTRLEVARLAVTGLGARVVGRGHLAGLVCMEAEAYRSERVGEVTCLYTVSRLSGSGAGALLVDGVVEQAGAQGLESVFAVTVSEAAGAFFERRGFERAGHDDVPARKWDGYDPMRRRDARVYIRGV